MRERDACFTEPRPRCTCKSVLLVLSCHSQVQIVRFGYEVSLVWLLKLQCTAIEVETVLLAAAGAVCQAVSHANTGLAIIIMVRRC